MAAAAFSFPDIFDFPPFFTLQPVDSTRAKQLQQWCQLITSWHQAHKQTTMVVKEWPCWENKAISRRLGDDGIAAVMDKLVASGNGEWEDAARTRCKIFYVTPAEWAARIHKFIVENGMAADKDNIYTVYELHSGRMCETAGKADGAPPILSPEWLVALGHACTHRKRKHADFFGMDPIIMMKALEVLEKNGLARLFPGSSVDECGVSFKER